MEVISSTSPLSSKRQREDEPTTQEENNNEDVFKRQKSYKDIITLLEEEEDEPNENLSSLISTLQEEISSSNNATTTTTTTTSSSSPSLHGPGPVHDPASSWAPYETDPESQSVGSGSGAEERDNVMRHLLEASDDELGLPNASLSDGFDEVVGGEQFQFDGGDIFFDTTIGGEGLWEFEDREAANYYSLLQSTEIFM